MDELREAITDGRASLGIELGSTRIKACLIGDDPSLVLAVGSHDWENKLVDRLWTYSLDDIWAGIRAAYAGLVTDVENRYGIRPQNFRAIGISAMMHGYLPFDSDGDLLVPFRTWRNTNTGPAAAELTELFGVNIPLRWSIAHLHQAVLDNEAHVADVRTITSLAGYVHWRLTGENVIGIGDASGLFPIDSNTMTYDAALLDRYETRIGSAFPSLKLAELLPRVLVAGEPAGSLTAAGAALLDPSGTLQPGPVFCPPEGDAGTGMVATGSVAPRTGNISAGTSIFAMVVLDRPLQNVHHELDLVTTPAGHPVAMVHCNNGASELAAWVGLFSRFAAAAGAVTATGDPLGPDTVFDTLFREALIGAPDAGGLLAYNYLAGEPITELTEGRPLFLRTPDSDFTLANFMRSQLYGVFGTLVLGMRVLSDEGVELDRMFAHGGLFRTAGVSQKFLAGALAVPVSVAKSASEGGPWGIAVLASYTAACMAGSDLSLEDYLSDHVFASTTFNTAEPDPADIAGFASYLRTYDKGLAVQRAAVDTLTMEGPTA